MTNIEKVKEKLQKLKSLSKSPNENEMLQAIRKMKEVLNEHGLKEEDIPDIETGAVKVERVEIFKSKKGVYTESKNPGEYPIDQIRENNLKLRTLKDWEKDLASSVARAFDCICTFKSFTLCFYGFKEDVMVTKEMYQWIINTMKKRAKIAFKERNEIDSNINPITFHYSFMIGVTNAIKLKTEEILEEKENLDSVEKDLLGLEEKGTNLAVIKKTQIEAAVGDTKNVSLNVEARDFSAEMNGYEAGSEISLRRQVYDKEVKGYIKNGKTSN